MADDSFRVVIDLRAHKCRALLVCGKRQETRISATADDGDSWLVHRARLLQLRYQTNQTCPFCSILRLLSRTGTCQALGCAALGATRYAAVTLRPRGPTQRTSRRSGLSRALRGRMENPQVMDYALPTSLVRVHLVHRMNTLPARLGYSGGLLRGSPGGQSGLPAQGAVRDGDL